MPYSFELKLTITGNSLDEIDRALTEAATERLRARMVNKIPAGAVAPANMPPAGLNFVPPATKEEPQSDSSGINKLPNISANATVERHADNSAQTEEKRKPGRPKKSAETTAEPSLAAQSNTQASSASSDAPASIAPAAAVQAGEQTIAGAPATPAAAIEALKLVNKKHNVDKARECLGKFGVAKCGELTDANRHLFIQHCESICV